MSKEMMLSYYTVISVERKTGRIICSNIIAASAEDALGFERRYFGEPFFRVLRVNLRLT